MTILKNEWEQAYRLRRIGFSICDTTNHLKIRDALRIATGHINNGERHYNHSVVSPVQTPVAPDEVPTNDDWHFHPSKECEVWCHSRQEGFTHEDCNCW